MPSIPARTICAAATAGASLLAPLAARPEIIDRVAAIVGMDAVTLSEVQAELSLEAMFAETEVPEASSRSDPALRRLIDRRLILQDMALTPFLMPGTDEIEREMDALRQRRYRDGLDFAGALAHYGLTESDCRSFLEQRIAFERYLSFRFRTGLSAGEAEIGAYYREEYLPAILERGEEPAPLEQVSGQIAEIIVEQRSSELLEQRLRELRSLNRIETMLGPQEVGEP